jgi:Na+-driven multidrug efflux pump
MINKKDVRFFPIFLGATAGVVLEIIATLVDEIVVGNIFNDEAFASVNLIEPYTYFEMFIAYLVSVGGAALIVRARGAGNHKKMSELFSQTIILCGLFGIGLTLVYILFTPQLVRFVADDPSVYENALAYFKIMRFYPLVDMFDTFMFTYVLYRSGFVHFYIAIISRIGLNAFLSWYLGSQMGLMGIGLASITSLLIALLIKSTFLLTKKHGLSFRWYLNVREALEIAKLGFPESALSMFMVIMEMALNAFTLKNYAAAGVAAVASDQHL